MREKQEFYVTLYITDDINEDTADWHTTMHASQLLYDGDYFQNIAKGINHQLQKNERHNERYRNLITKHEILLSDWPGVKATGYSKSNYAGLKGCYIVKVNLEAEKRKLAETTVALGTMAIKKPILANEILEILTLGLKPDYKLRLFSEKPKNTATLQSDEIALFYFEDLYYYMLKEDTEAMPILDIQGDPNYYHFQNWEDMNESWMMRWLARNFKNATPEGYPLPNQKFDSIIEQVKMVLVGAIAKQDSRVKKHGQIYNDFPIHLIHQPLQAEKNRAHFFTRSEEGNPIPTSGQIQTLYFELDAFACPITYKQMKDPVFCTLDKTTYERKAIEDWFRNNRTSPISRATMPAGIAVRDILFPHVTLKTPTFFICPITQEKMKDPVFCTLDNLTYEREAIENWLQDHLFSPIDKTKFLPVNKLLQDILFPNLAIQHAIEEQDSVEPPVNCNSL